MNTATTARLGLLSLLTVLAGCGQCDPLANTTRLRVTVVAGVIEMDQIEVSVVREGVLIVAPHRVPEAPSGTLSSQESVVVVVDDEFEGQTVRIRVDGFLSDALVASGATEALPVQGEIVDVQVAMGAPATVGDGLIARGIEDCDDGNTLDGDGCSSLGTFEAGWLCNTAEPTLCSPNCGDGRLVGAEECDDNNNEVQDGCSGCTVEPGWTCNGSPSVCEAGCGDGIILGFEACDDANLENGDGCSDNCTVDEGYVCTGQPSHCVSCGDGLISEDEDCDDGNAVDGDGCGADCRVEPTYTCEGVPSVCVTPCGDGAKAGNEACDDGNTMDGDGCDASCVVETGYVCDENAAGTSQCTPVCGDGVLVEGESCDLPDTPGCSAVCVTEPGWVCDELGCVGICGDGEIVAGEQCDDGNPFPGDGCSSFCQVEPNICGNGIIEGQEGCDDGNADNADGCSDACRVEANFVCFSQPSVCSDCGNQTLEGLEQCDDGNAINTDGCFGCVVQPGWSCIRTGDPDTPELCVMQCGDGDVRVDDGEECDDGNTVAGDGCSPGCRIEAGFACPDLMTCSPVCNDGLITGDETCDPDGAMVAGCTDCQEDPGFTCTGTPTTQCVDNVCGDGLLGNGEACDDGNVIDGDGCTAACAVEGGYVCPLEGAPCIGLCGDGQLRAQETCDDGGVLDDDGCSSTCAVEFGFSCDNDPVPSVCAPNCGDGAVIEGFEGCDDGNLTNQDGCSSACAVEAYWTCNGEPSMCTGDCGDGVLVGNETCDDGNEQSGDGCSVACQVEDGYECFGAPSICPRCGDGTITAPYEECDDENTAADDGCSDDCTIEVPYMCEGEPSLCFVCGDGKVAAPFEECDDENAASSDGCSANCEIEPNFVCAGAPSVCARCGDGQIEPLLEACDDQNTTNGDGCSSSCQTEAGYTCQGEPSMCLLTAGCGNGILDPGEECDDGALVQGDGCDAQCDIEPGYDCPTPGMPCVGCGDGIVQDERMERCDDNNNDNGDGCDSDCQVTPGWVCTDETVSPSVCGLCGDSIVVDQVEECDLGDSNADDGACTTECLNTYCGDQLVATQGNTAGLIEQCDNGNNGLAGACPNCKSAVCGDGFTYPAAEGCDNAGNNGDHQPCLSVCVFGTCGDGLRSPALNEGCDPGGNGTAPGCLNCVRQPAANCAGEPSVCRSFAGNWIDVGHCALDDEIAPLESCLFWEVALAPDGAVIYFPPGEYADDLFIDRNLVLVGNVSAGGLPEAVLHGSVFVENIEDGTRTVRLQNLAIDQGDFGQVVFVGTGAYVEMEGMNIGPSDALGVLCFEDGAVNIQRSFIHDNLEGGVEIDCDGGTNILINNRIGDNGHESSAFGGVRLREATLMSFNTIVGNVASIEQPGGVRCNGAGADSTIARGLIVYFNGGSENYDDGCSNTGYSNIEGLSDLDLLGTGNFDSDPLLGNNDQLLPGSPCIDAVDQNYQVAQDAKLHPRPHPSSDLADCGWDESGHYIIGNGTGTVPIGNGPEGG